jgi:hypothetical protein
VVRTGKEEAETYKNIELHLLEYNQVHLEYVESLQSRPRLSPFEKPSFIPFSAPRRTKNDPTHGYDDKSISDEIITEVFTEFGEKTRQRESDDYLCTLSGMQWISWYQDKFQVNIPTSSKVPFTRSHLPSGSKSDCDRCLGICYQADEGWNGIGPK